MSPKLKQGITIAVSLAAVQALLFGIYWTLREKEPADVGAERLRRAAPELAYRTPDGGEARLSELRGEPVVLHFWATWCGPCREELPTLLEFAGEDEIRVLAVSVDPEWGPVRRFLGGELPPSVVLASGDSASRDFGVSSLPQTFVLDAAGRLRLRFPGPRDWSSGAVRAAVLGVEDG